MLEIWKELVLRGSELLHKGTIQAAAGREATGGMRPFGEEAGLANFWPPLGVQSVDSTLQLWEGEGPDPARGRPALRSPMAFGSPCPSQAPE